MKLTKKYINEEVKKAWNSTNVIGGFKIAVVGWKEYGRFVIENKETFEDATKDDFIPIQVYKTQKELVDGLYKLTNK